MNEREPQISDGVNFIKTPITFFGHGDEIYFGYPQAYDNDMQAAQVQLAEDLASLQEYRDQLIAEGNLESNEYKRIVPQDQYEADIAYTTRRATEQVKQVWYERRYRGRYESLVDKDQHPEAHAFCISRYDKENPPPPTPSAGTMATYLNEHILNNQFSAAYDSARYWYNTLPEDHPDRDTAKDYTGFAGNIILHEYCHIAKALADDRLADDDFFSLKHLITVCWTNADQLEAIIPDEVKHAKQVLREIFLQYAVRGGATIRREATRLRIYNEDGEDDPHDHDGSKLKYVMRFDDTEEMDKDRIVEELLVAADLLESQEKWYRAIDVLDLAQLAFNLPRETIQKRIDQLGINGVLALTNDMSKYDEPKVITKGRHEYVTINRHEVGDLGRAPGLSHEAFLKMVDIEDTRIIEYQQQQYADAEDEASQTEAISVLFEKLANTSPELAKRFASTEIVDSIMERLTNPALASLSPSALDEMVVEVIKLRNKGVLTIEQQNVAFISIVENIMAAADDPDYQAPFERFIGWLSPLMRATSKKAPEDPDQEVVWRLISKKQFEEFMDKAVASRKAKGWDSELEEKYKQAFLLDIRKSLSHYWDRIQEYGW